MLLKFKNFIKQRQINIDRKKYGRENEPREFDVVMQAKIRKELEMQIGSENICDYKFDLKQYYEFEKRLGFQKFYNKGIWSRYERKIAEYYIVYNILEFDKIKVPDTYLYIDGASSSSPWAEWCRKNLNIKAFSVDLVKPKADSEIFIQGDITKLPFENGSVSAISLQSALETFPKMVDIEFIEECGRVLQKNGKVVISPLYLNADYCNCFGKSYYENNEAEEGAKKCYRFDYDMPFTRLYDVGHLNQRICSTAIQNGMSFKIYEIEATGLKLLDKQHPYIYMNYFIIMEKTND